MQQSKIEETVELAVKKVGSLVPELKAALSNQVKEETTKLVSQTKLVSHFSRSSRRRLRL
jgi:hypothetical protein